MKKYKRIGAVQKTCEILTFLSEQKITVSAVELSKALDIPKPTLLCYLSTLEDADIVSRAGEKYELGFKLAMFWASFKRHKKDRINEMRLQLKQLEVDDEQ